MSDEMELASALFGTSRIEGAQSPDNGETKTLYGTAVEASSNGSVRIALDGSVTSTETDGEVTGDNVIEVPTTAFVAKGDEVVVTLVGSSTMKSPSVTGVVGGGDRMNEAVGDAAKAAEAAKGSAESAAASAKTANDNALKAIADAKDARDAADAAQASADSAQSSADAAKTAADKAQADATSAASAAKTANDNAGKAIADAKSAHDAADAAQTSADSANQAAAKANEAANGASNALAVTQGVVDALGRDMDDLQTHVSMQDDGLHVTPLGDGYYTVVGSDGMRVYDPQSNLVATFGESVDFSSSRPQRIGNDDAYVLYDGNGNLSVKADSLTFSSGKTVETVAREAAQAEAASKADIGDVYAKTESDAQMKALSDRIEQTVTEARAEYAQASELSDANAAIAAIEQRTSQVEQTASGISATLTQRVEGIDGSLSELRSHVDVGQTADGRPKVSLSTDDSGLRTELTSDKLSFVNGNEELAYASGNEFHMVNATVDSILRFGGFAFVPRTSDGSMSLKWVGDC